MSLSTTNVDVIVIGGGPSGLQCALVLARANRSIIVFDSGEKRNEVSYLQHAILGSDGEVRSEFIDKARNQLLRYPTVQFQNASVTDIHRLDDNDESSYKFQVITNGGDEEEENDDMKHETYFKSKKLVLATGMKDMVPCIDGFDKYWGHGIYSCLYCNGYEYNHKQLAAFGNGNRGVHMAFEMLSWSKHVILFTHGEPLVANDNERKLLRAHHIQVIEDEIVKVHGKKEKKDELGSIELVDGRMIDVDVLFFNTGRYQTSCLPEKMGLNTDDRGDFVCTSQNGNVDGIHGLYVAGNCASAPIKLIITAASQGAITGCKINSELLNEEFGLCDNNQEPYSKPFNEEWKM